MTLLECSSIQSYVFGSGRLAESAGASLLVRKALGDELRRHLQKHDELLFAGGGHAAVVFAGRDSAEEAVWKWSSSLRATAPGMRLGAVHIPYEPDGLAAAMAQAHVALARANLAVQPDAELACLPLTEACFETGLPATSVGRDLRKLSEVSRCRGQASDDARAEMEALFEESLRGEHAYGLTNDIGRLGQRAGESHIAVVHADGNRLGRKLMDLSTGPVTDDECKRRLRSFSKSIDDAARLALEVVIRKLVRYCDADVEGAQKLQLSRQDDRYLIPLRPIVVGGDDLTFVCEGRLGMWLASAYLEEFNRASLPADIGLRDPRLSACAGIAIVSTNYPFARAYALAAALTASAKSRARSGEGEESWMDFHVALGGFSGTLSSIRARQYTIALGDGRRAELAWRPWRVAPADVEGSNSFGFGTFTSVRNAFRGWQSRADVKALRAALEGGPDATARFVSVSGLKLPAVPGLPAIETTGWDGGRTPLYDVLETLDLLEGFPE